MCVVLCLPCAGFYGKNTPKTNRFTRFFRCLGIQGGDCAPFDASPVVDGLGSVGVGVARGAGHAVPTICTDVAKSARPRAASLASVAFDLPYANALAFHRVREEHVRRVAACGVRFAEVLPAVAKHGSCAKL